MFCYCWVVPQDIYIIHLKKVENIKYFETGFNADTEIKDLMKINKYKLDKKIEL